MTILSQAGLAGIQSRPVGRGALLSDVAFYASPSGVKDLRDLSRFQALSFKAITGNQAPPLARVAAAFRRP